MAQALTAPDLYVEHLKDMDGMESQITQALPQVSKTAEISEFKKMLEHHLKQTEEHVTRLEQIWFHSP